MKIDNINQSNTFKALYVPSDAYIAKKAGNRFAEAVTKARPTLERCAENCDLHILPYKFSSRDRGLAIKVGAPTKSPIKHFFTKLNIKYNAFLIHKNLPSNFFMCVAPLVTDKHVNSADTIADMLKFEAAELTQKISAYNELMRYMFNS